MPELILLSSEEQILTLEPDENPADIFPVMYCNGIHADARAQLYTSLLGVFFDEAQSLEELCLEMDLYGPFVFRLDQGLMERLADIAEDQVPGVVQEWSRSGEIESLGVYDSDLVELLSTFLFNLIHFCVTARQESELSVYIYSDS